MAERLHAWLHACLLGPIADAGAPQPPHRAFASAGAAAAADLPVAWTAADERVAVMFGSPLARAAFLRVLQAQIMLAAGLARPLAGALPAAALQLQPLLGLGTSDEILSSGVYTAASQLVGAAQGATPGTLHFGLAVRTLLVLALAPARFHRLTAMLMALLAEARADGDFLAAGAALQAASAVCTSGGRRLFLHRTLEREPLWRTLPFWEAHVLAAVATEEQAARILAGGAAAAPEDAPLPAPARVVAVLTSLLGPSA